MELPKKYLENMQNLLQNEYQAYLDSFDKKRYYGLRVNTSKISVDDFLKISPFKLEKIDWCKDGFYYDENDKPAKHPYYYAGLYYLQEPSAMLPAEVLEIEENDVVLDGCAAPGGKSCKLANKLNGSGLLISNDISSSRCMGLLKNIELFGFKNVLVCSEDLNSLANRYDGMFDKILIDAPCSGEGMFRKEPSLINNWKENYYPDIQKRILNNAIKMLKPSGKLVYSTCTFNVCENEEVIKDAMAKNDDLYLLEVPNYPGFVDGLLGLRECKRLYPHKIKGEGHFVCYMAKKGTRIDNNIENIGASLPNYINDFLSHIKNDFLGYHYIIVKDKVLLVSDYNIKRNIRTISDGLLIGTFKNNNFEPSTALALSLKKEQFDQVIDLSVDDDRVIKYLKGETISVSQYDYEGYVLICVNGYPLGFGKITKGVFKNKYDRNWRYI